MDFVLKFIEGMFLAIAIPTVAIAIGVCVYHIGSYIVSFVTIDVNVKIAEIKKEINEKQMRKGK